MQSLRTPRGSVQGFGRVCKRQKLQRQQQQCRAGMGISFTEDFQTIEEPSSSELLLPSSSEFGLSAKQMGLLGLTNQGLAKLPEVKAVRGTQRAGRVLPSHRPGSSTGGLPLLYATRCSLGANKSTCCSPKLCTALPIAWAYLSSFFSALTSKQRVWPAGDADSAEPLRG
jgi:hypothetical protein